MEKDAIFLKEDDCVLMRDGRIIEMGEKHSNRKKLSEKPALGYFGYSYLKDNGDKLKAASVEGVFTRVKQSL